MSAAQPQLPLKVLPGKWPDVRALAAKVFERHGIALAEDDPAFALVTLNELILRKVIGEMLKEVDQHITARRGEFEQTMQRVEARASQVLAQQVRESAGALRETLREEIGGAHVEARQMLAEVRDACRFGSLARWCAVGVVVVLVVFGCGFWAGRP
jgi:CHASE3 domain sensor protein